MFDPIEWARVNRGIRWHLLTGMVRPDGTGSAGSAFLCGEVDRVKEVTRDLPPTGGTPCHRCLRRVQELSAVADRALADAVQDTLIGGRAAPADAVSVNLLAEAVSDAQA